MKTQNDVLIKDQNATCDNAVLSSRLFRFRAWNEKIKWMSKTFTFGQVLNFHDQIIKSLTNEENVMQFTGLKDKNGNMIWENDICDRKEQYPEIVKYCNGDWTLDYSYVSNKKSGANYCNLGFYTEERKCVEVIGNIFDNPELLESEK